MKATRKMASCILVGDIIPIHPSRIAVDDILSGSESNSITLGNLEAPIVNDLSSPRPKGGPSLHSNILGLPEIANSASNMVLSLANNHTMDYGDYGLVATKNACAKTNIKLLGAGSNLNDAKTPVILRVGDITIGILARCETQYGTATQNRSGVASLDPGIYTDIEHLSKQVDFVVLTVHGAAELCPWPSPHWQDLMRSFVDAGVSIVHGHHAHVPQGYELYNNGLITYGLGNFLVQLKKYFSKVPNANWSLVIRAQLAKTVECTSVNTVVIDEEDGCVGVRCSSDDEHKAHINYLMKCSRPLSDRNLLTGLWQEASIRMFTQWHAKGLGLVKPSITFPREIRSMLGRIVRRQWHIPNPGKSDFLGWYNYFACESHNDTIATALGVLGGELEDFRTSETEQLVSEMMNV